MTAFALILLLIEIFIVLCYVASQFRAYTMLIPSEYRTTTTDGLVLLGCGTCGMAILSIMIWVNHFIFDPVKPPWESWIGSILVYILGRWVSQRVFVYRLRKIAGLYGEESLTGEQIADYINLVRRVY